jgi:hypothetical protein
LVVLLVCPWLWVGGRFIPVFMDFPFVPLSAQHQQYAWTLALVLPSIWVARVALRALSKCSKTAQWVCGVLFTLVGLVGVGGVWLLLGLAMAFDAMSEPHPVTEPAHCITGGGGQMIDGVVTEWTACAGADESFLQGRLLYLDGEGVADGPTCQAFKAAKASTKPETVWCDAAEPEFWTRVSCPPFAGPKATMCFECRTQTPSVDDYKVLLGWTTDCSQVHVVRSINLDLDQVASRAADLAL